MNRRTVFACVGVATVLAWMSGQVLAQEGESHEGHSHAGHDHAGHDHAGHDHDKPASGQEATMMDPQAMAAMMKAMSPGEHHAHLKPLAGPWKLVIKHRMTQEMPWEESTGTTDAEFIMGGRFLAQKTTGEGMMGMPFEGMGIMGYDNAKGEYVSTWIDNMGTGIAVMKGQCSNDGKVISFEARLFNPMTGEDIDTRFVYRIESPDRFIMESYMPGADGKMFMNMEIVNVR